MKAAMCVSCPHACITNFFALVVFSRDSAGIRQTSRFVEWQCVQIGAHKHDRACAIRHHAHNAETGYARLIILADTVSGLLTGGLQFLAYDRSGSLPRPGKLSRRSAYSGSRETR